MATLRAFICITILAVFAKTSSAANYNVGGSSGWSLSTDSATWASKQSFKVGDSITFSYSPQHSVNEVNKADYDTCSLSKPIRSYIDGNTKIQLSSSGKRYFICGTASHCDGGMKVEIVTVSAAVATPPLTPPVISPVKQPPSKAPLAPSPSKTPSTPPPVKSPPMVPEGAPPTETPSGVSPDAAPTSNTPLVGEPTPNPSGANKLVACLVTSMIMIALF